MAQRQTTNGPYIRRIPPRTNVQYYLGPRGLILFLLALLVLFIGGIGYLEYDNIVKPYLSIYICCLPSALLAVILLFFGFATRFTTVRQVQIQKPFYRSNEQIIDMTKPGEEFGQSNSKRSKTAERPDTSSRPGSSHSTNGASDVGLRKFKPEQLSKDELLAKKRNLNQFLKDLDNQHRDGLIMDNVYVNLKAKYRQELRETKALLNINGSKPGRTTSKKKKKNI